MKLRAVLAALVPYLAALPGCIPSGSVPDDPLPACAPDGGEDAGENAPDAGDGTLAPADLAFSFGMTDNSGGAPQGASFVNLRFRGGTPSLDTVVARRVATPITLDGLDADWADIAPSLVPLETRGNPIGLSAAGWTEVFTSLGFPAAPPYDWNLSSAIVKAAYDDDNLYFLFEWSDSTESAAASLLSFNGVSWSKAAQNNEDRLYLAFEIGGSFPGFAALGCAAACHLTQTDKDKNYRTRMHTTAPGELVDVWSWRATTTNPLGYADDQYWDEASKKGDSPLELAISNLPADGGTLPLYMSEEGVNANPSVLYAAGSGLSPKAVPYDGTALDAGARLPGYVHQLPGAARRDVRAVGKWRNGHWTVELSRALVTSDTKDAQFPLE